jgi:hypothetical protein
LAAALLASAVPASAGDRYSIQGLDSFTVGSDDQRGDIAYAGRETLVRERRGGVTRFTARARFERIDQGAKSMQTAVFVEDILADGSSRDVGSGDPDFLTILNQPFSVLLDRETMQALRSLKGAVPFDFPAPMVGASVRGRLKHAIDGRISGREAVGISFEAQGPMNGRLPGRAVQLSGTLKLQSRAYYDALSAMLLSMEMRLEIAGHIVGDADPQPVKIVYWRAIRIDPPAGPRSPLPASPRAAGTVQEARLPIRNAKPST